METGHHGHHGRSVRVHVSMPLGGDQENVPTPLLSTRVMIVRVPVNTSRCAFRKAATVSGYMHECTHTETCAHAYVFTNSCTKHTHTHTHTHTHRHVPFLQLDRVVFLLRNMWRRALYSNEDTTGGDPCYLQKPMCSQRDKSV